MGLHQGSVAGAGGPCRRDGEGQPAVRGGRAVSLSGRHSMAGLARAVWRPGNHTRFSRWAKSGVWERVFNHLSDDADNEYAMVDSTIVRAHQHSAGARKKGGEDQAIGRSRGGLSTKIHATVDALGNPTGFHLTGGQEHDLAGADALLPELEAETLIAD